MPAAPLALGSFAAPALSLRRMVAASATFQRDLFVNNSLDAAERVFLRNVLGTERRPYATIEPGPRHEFNLIAGGQQNDLRPSGSLFLYLARDSSIPTSDDLIESAFENASVFGQIIDEIACKAAGEDPLDAEFSYLPIVRIQMLAFDETPQECWQSLGRYWYAAYNVEWGDE